MSEERKGEMGEEENGNQNPADDSANDSGSDSSGQEEKNQENASAENLEASDSTELDSTDQAQKIKTLLSAVILLFGIAAGSFFVDVIQLLRGQGYSERALKKADVFMTAGKTWVAFDDPVVEVKVLTLEGEELEACPNCDPEEALMWMKKIIPTMVPKKVTVSSDEGQKMIEKYNLKTVPAFVFSDSLEKTELYEDPQVETLFNKKGNVLIMDSISIGIPVGKYLNPPEIGEDDPVIGDRKAPTKIVVFSDYQCPYCQQYFEEVTQAARDLEDQVVLTYKELPLDFHPQARSASMAAQCANEQDKFWEMSEMLYENQAEWGQVEGDANAVFERYAVNLGMERESFSQCLDEKRYNDKIESDLEEAVDFGISGTPATFVNDQLLSGLISADQLKMLIASLDETADAEVSSAEDEEVEEMEDVEVSGEAIVE